MGLLITCIAIVVGWAVLGLFLAVFWHHMKKGQHASPLDTPRIQSDPTESDPHSDSEGWPPIR